MGGLLPDNSIIEGIDAIVATAKYISVNVEDGNLAGALHAGQDLLTPAHMGKQWNAMGVNWETVNHALGDWAPTHIDIVNAMLVAKVTLDLHRCK